MEEQYFHGTLLCQSDNNVRIYFVIEPQKWFFIRDMIKYGWKIVEDKYHRHKNLDGWMITLERNCNNKCK